MATYRTSLGFARLSDSPLNSFADNVVQKMTGNESFAAPIISMASLAAARTVFANAIAAAMQGGRQNVAAKNAARTFLLSSLRQEAAYVQSIAGEDLAMLLSSGFDAVRTNHTQVVLVKPEVERLDNPQSTQLGLRLKRVPTARAYEVRMSYGTSGWQLVGLFTYSRPILIENLTPGITYTVQARAIGGSTGYSDWSDPISRMAM